MSEDDGLHVFVTREREYLEGNRLPMCRQASCGVEGGQRADGLVCLFGRENGKNHRIDVRLEEGPIHPPRETMTQNMIQDRVPINAIVSQELFQLAEHGVPSHNDEHLHARPTSMFRQFMNKPHLGQMLGPPCLRYHRSCVRIASRALRIDPHPDAEADPRTQKIMAPDRRRDFAIPFHGKADHMMVLHQLGRL